MIWRRAGVAAALLMLVAPPAAAGGGDRPSWDGQKENNGAHVEGTVPGESSGGYQTAPVSDGSTAPTGPSGPWTEEKLVPFCMQSSIGQNEDVMCTGMVESCPENQLRWRVYHRLVHEDGTREDWTYEGTRCEGPDAEAGVQEPEVTRQDVVDSAYAAAPVPDFVIEPADKSYVNVPTNFAAADDEPVTVTVYPLEIAIPVTFTPTSYRWDFGDGGTGTGAGVRNASVGAPGAVEHGYGSSGSYDVTLTRVYTIAFTLPSGESVTIPGEVSATSEPQTLQVGEIQSTVTGVG